MSSNFESNTYNRAAVHDSNSESRRADGNFAPSSTMVNPNPGYGSTGYEAERPTEGLSAATHHTGGFQPHDTFSSNQPSSNLTSGTKFSTEEVKRNPYPTQTLEERGAKPWSETDNEFQDNTTTTTTNANMHETTHPKPKLTDKIVGGAQVAVGKVTKNEGLLEKGIERKAGEHRTRQTEDNY